MLDMIFRVEEKAGVMPPPQFPPRQAFEQKVVASMTHAPESASPAAHGPAETPMGNLQGFTKYWAADLKSGFLVFLIALPLCLAIASASGYPPIAGLFTAMIGGLLTGFFSNSEMTIKGPAAGLILIALGAITEMKEIYGENGYAMVLGIGVVAGLLQVAFALARGGVLSDFFPISAVHGMLAAIGVIIILKQFPIALGNPNNKGEPIELIERIPETIAGANPQIAIIGIVSLVMMFALNALRTKVKVLKAVPPQVIVLLFAICMTLVLGLNQDESKPMAQANSPSTSAETTPAESTTPPAPASETHAAEVTAHAEGEHAAEGEHGAEAAAPIPKSKYLVALDPKPFSMFSAFTFPKFDAVFTGPGMYWIMMFAVIGTLESLLSAKAVDMLDPHKRKTNLNRDVLAVGAANTLAAFIGGLPMISEIVRSKANIDNGAKTRFANFWHGLLLVVCVATIPMLIHLIPVAALAAMLIFTGFRLASPAEFLHVYRVGKEQLIIFVGTLVAVLLTDLLIGICVGIGIKFLIHLVNGVPIRSLFLPYLNAEVGPNNTVVIHAHHSAVFSNWILFRRRLLQLGSEGHENVTLDLSKTKLVDHSVMEKLHELEEEFHAMGLKFQVVGLENHRSMSDHPYAARKLKAV